MDCALNKPFVAHIEPKADYVVALNLASDQMRIRRDVFTSGTSQLGIRALSPDSIEHQTYSAMLNWGRGGDS